MVIKNLKDYEGFVESLFKVDESNPELVKIVYMNFSKDKIFSFINFFLFNK